MCIYCNNCDQQNFLYLGEVGKPSYVVCPNCGWETSYVFCSDCQIGGEFVSNISDHPGSWFCPDCMMEYQLPADFYKNPSLVDPEAKEHDWADFAYQEGLRSWHLHDEQAKWEGLLFLGFLTVPFASIIPSIVALDQGVSLTPLGMLWLVNLGWSVFVGIRYKMTSWEEYQNLPNTTRRKRLYYDSYWWYLYRGFLAIICGLAWIWGLFAQITFTESTEDYLTALLLFSISLILIFLGIKALWLSRQQFLKANQHDSFETIEGS